MNATGEFRILVVDDDSDLRSISKKLLIKAGYTVKTAVDGKECMGTVFDFRPELLLLDVMLPDTSGIELCQRIKADPSLSRIYIILVSGRKTSPDDISDGLETGADGYLIKPVVPRELMARVEAARRVILAEKKLLQSEERFRNLFEHSTVGKSMTRLDGNIIVNQAFCDIVGFSQEELQTRKWYELTHPDDVANDRQIMQSILQKKIQSFRWEKRYIHKTGNIVLCDVSSILERDKDGKPIYFLTSMIDITQQKIAEEILRLSEEKFAITFRSAFQAIAITRSYDGLIHEVNESFIRFTGYSYEEVIGKTTIELHLWFNEEDRLFVVSKLKNGEKISDLEFQFRTKAGIILFGLYSCELIRIKDEIYLLSSITDITERKRLEDALKANEENLTITLNSIGDGVISTDIQGRVERMNPMAEKLCGWMFEEAKGKPLNEIFRIINAVTRENIANPVDLVFKERKVFGLANHTLLISKNGPEYHIADSAAPILNKEGQIIGVVLVFSDVTEKYTVQKALRESEEKYRMLIEEANEAIIVAQDGVFMFANPKVCQLLGIPEKELIGRQLIDFIYKEDRELVFRRYQQRITGEPVPESSEFRVIGPGGEIRWVSLSAQQIVWQGRPATHNIMTDITERKSNEEEIQRKNTFIQTVLDNLPMAIAMNKIDDGTAFYINKQFENIYGWPQEEMGSIAGFFNKVYPDETYRNELMQRVMADIESGDLSRMHWENCLVTHQDGSRHVINASNIPLFEQNIMVSTAMDVTEITRKEVELKQSESRFKLLIENSPDAITLISREGAFKYVSNSARKMFGFTTEELTDLSPVGLTHPDDLAAVIANLVEIQQFPEKVITCEYRFRHKNNTWLWIESTFTNLFAEQAVEAIVINFHDITARKRLEKIQQVQYNIAKAALTSGSLEELMIVTKDQLSSLIDTTNFFVAFYNEETRTLHKAIWVDEQDEFEEWKAENSLSGLVVTKKATLLLTRNEIDRIAEENGLTLVGTKAACWLGVPLITDEKVIGAMVAQSYNDPFAYDKSSAVLLEMIAHELSLYIEREIARKELVIAKEKAEQSDRLKSDFLANMSHEIRTPMNAIVGFAGMLTDIDLTPVERNTYAGIVKSRSDDLLHLINDILDISRIESGDATMEKSEVHLNKLLEELETVTLEKIQRVKKNHLKLECEKNLPVGQDVFVSDPYIIRQIMFNLLDNALKFTMHGAISCGYLPPANGMITFFVSDTGIGIAPENQDLIFKTFRQADIADHHKYGGTGLGLAICKGSVELLGGKIWLESTPGKGSTFFFTVPFEQHDRPSCTRDEAPQAGLQQTPAVPETRLWPGKKLVLVEDDPTNMEFLRIVLAHTGAELLLAFSGSDLRKIYPDLGTVDLVLLDMRLPDANGWDLAREIKAIRKDLPVIAQTAFAMMGDKEKSLAAGCDNYLPKPISKAKLFQMLSHYLPGKP